MSFEKIAVIGAGQMGAGIAQAAAASGYKVVLRDVADEFLARARTSIEASLGKFVEVIRGQQTSDATHGAAVEFASSLGKEDRMFKRGISAGERPFGGRSFRILGRSRWISEPADR